jgi:hypothetical protein
MKLLARSILLVVGAGLLIGCSDSAKHANNIEASQTPKAQEEPDAPFAWERAVVLVEVTRKQYDYYLPWTRRTRRTLKSGLVIGERQILTTADQVFDRTLIRLQKGGRGKWSLGEVTWVDYHANLALVTTSEDGFWTDLKPARLGPMPANSSLQILRWRENKLENRKAEFTQFSVREGQLSALNHVQLEVACEIQDVGSGEPIVANGHVVGLITTQAGRTCIASPASFVQTILEGRQGGAYRGLGFFHFFWQPAENTTSLEMLGLTGAPRGVLVTSVGKRPDGGENTIKPRDIILQIDGFDIDIEGDYTDPEFGHLMLENLAVRRKWAGDEVKIRILRDQKPLEVAYRLPKFEYTNSLLPDAVYDQEPEYFLVGGLLFQPLTDAYLQSWGADWKRRAPFRLNFYNTEEPTAERPALVLLSQVFPDPYNIGYQEQKYLVVDQVNGQRIRFLAELRDALQKPVDGFHVIEFRPGEALRKIVLEAGAAEREATARVRENYRIPHEFYFAPKAGS